MGARAKREEEAYNKAQEETELLKQKAEEYTGEEGLKKATENAKQSSQDIANSSAQDVMKTAKTLGMNSASAMQQGQQSVADTYARNYTNERNVHYGAGMDNLGSQSNVLGAQQAMYGAAKDAYDRSANRWANGLSGVANAVATIGRISDEKTKDIQAIDYDPIAEFKKIKPIKYKYKEEYNIDDKEHNGVTAQDLEKSKATETAVEEVDGIKQVDTQELTMTNTLALGEIARRIEAIEKKIGG
jgi:hypothetical protein